MCVLVCALGLTALENVQLGKGSYFLIQGILLVFFGDG